MIENKNFKEVFEKIKDKTLISIDRLEILWKKLIECKHVDGNIYECGVYKGGSAYLLKKCCEVYEIDKRLYLFDTFTGMPPVNPKEDLHHEKDFNDVVLDKVVEFIGTDNVVYKCGRIPETFIGLELDKISFAHIDVDIHKSVLDCCEFIWPRLSKNGIIVFDDYGFDTCPGAKKAVDEYFKDKSKIDVLETKQAIVMK